MATKLAILSDNNDHLQTPEGEMIELESKAWLEWLSSNVSFRFIAGEGGSQSFTARKESIKGGGGLYWYAYKKVAGKLHKSYIGQSEDLSLDKLKEVATKLILFSDPNQVLPELPQENRVLFSSYIYEKLPNAPVVYFLWLEAKVMYVGQTTSLCKRIKGHHILWRRVIEAGEDGQRAEISWMEVEDDKQRRFLEGRYIALLKPDWNGKGAAKELTNLDYVISVKDLQAENEELKAKLLQLEEQLQQLKSQATEEVTDRDRQQTLVTGYDLLNIIKGKNPKTKTPVKELCWIAEAINDGTIIPGDTAEMVKHYKKMEAATSKTMLEWENRYNKLRDRTVGKKSGW